MKVKIWLDRHVPGEVIEEELEFDDDECAPYGFSFSDEEYSVRRFGEGRRLTHAETYTPLTATVVHFGSPTGTTYTQEETDD